MANLPQWVTAFALEEVPVGGARLFRGGGKQVAVFRTGAEQLYAVANQCPHEGYPLVKGYVKDCVVTCAWHNFKFDLRDGRCVMGDEGVRTFPLRLNDGCIELDLADGEPEEEMPGLLASLEEGLVQRRLGQVARNIVRLLRAGVPPQVLALFAARFDAERSEYGTTHVMPMAVDILRFVARYPGVQAVLPLMQPMDMASENHQRLPRRPVQQPADPGDDPRAAGARLRELAEAEDAFGAEALLRGAIERGWGREVIEPWLFRLCTDHFLDFGHALIYQIKIFDLLDRAGWQHAFSLLPAHLLRIISGTRDDALPTWQWFRARLAAIEPRFPELLSRKEGTDVLERGPFLNALLDGDREDAFGVTERALCAGVAPGEVLDMLIIGAAARLLRFDVDIDRDPGVQEGWLDVTHLLTFASAVRQALARYREPDVLRLVFFAVRFINNARPLDLPEDRRPTLRADGADGSVDEIVTAIGSRRAADAVALSAGYIAADRPLGPLRIACEDLTLNDPAVRPIFVGHLIKTGVTAFDETERLRAGSPGDPLSAYPVLAFVRLLASPRQERRVAQLAHEAINFVVHEKVPRTLT